MDARRLLLGGVAGHIAVVGAHAAEMPVKAKAVQYVRVCTLYGDGFYFIPGTQTCMKIGGFVRAEIKYDVIGSFEPATRVRTGISLDAAGADRVRNASRLSPRRLAIHQQRRADAQPSRHRSPGGRRRGHGRGDAEWRQ